MFNELGYIDGRLLFTHFRTHEESLDVGLLPLMFDEDVIGFLEHVPRFTEVEVYIETSISLVKRHMMERITSKVKGMVIEEIVDHDVNDVVGKEFDGESRKSGKLSLLEWNQTNKFGKDGTAGDKDFIVFDSNDEFPPAWSAEIMITNRTKRLSDEFEFKNYWHRLTMSFWLKNSNQDSLDSLNVVNFEQEMEEILYYDIDDRDSIIDEPEEISDMFVELNQALDELDQVIEAKEPKEISVLFADYD
uniref:Uncharacterized protein n=1 Tax=Tanacetum cinerariifolium TaxID=118510 RepID=A0A699GSZ2_TANCI|nr:hypothetical protein [Tanacetum cinerariifolium]